VVLVDSGSYDGSPEIARAHGARVLGIDSRDFTFGYSLNVGLRASAGRYIAIVSAHTAPLDGSWLGRLVAPLAADDVAMVYGRQLGTPTSKFGEVQDLRRSFGTRPRVLRPPRFFANNANSAVRADLFERHPFDETLPGLEDIEWAKHWMERGYKVVYEPSAPIYHIHDETWRQVRRRYYREAVAARWIGIKGRGDAAPEALREAGRLVADLAIAARQGSLPRRIREIALFRWHKAMGTVQGVWNGATLEDPGRRREMYFDTRSKAVVITGPGRAAYREVEVPEVKPGDVLVRVAYVGVCATDLEVLDGTLGYYKSGQASYPIVPGHEVSGRVSRVGPNVERLREGDAVVVECIQGCGACEECREERWVECRRRTELGVVGLNGGYSEYVVTPGVFVHKLMDHVDLRTACLIEPIAVVLKGLRRLEGAWGQGDAKRCAVVGAGPIGHLCAQVLALRGHRVTVFDPRAERRDAAVAAHPGIAAGRALEEISGHDVVVEATGSADVLSVVLSSSSPGATLLLLGFPYGQREFSFEGIVASDKTVVGSVGSAAQDFREAISLVGGLRLGPFLENVVPLEEFDAAWEACRSLRHLKVVLEVDAAQAAQPARAEMSGEAGPEGRS
jgi:2-desacetyl-2-hydroxyethyl bacteriochlorophyllide A dehydrogenase